jgi:archaellum component FlaF (FlaF/FlaG flagellin family)
MFSKGWPTLKRLLGRWTVVAALVAFLPGTVAAASILFSDSVGPGVHMCLSEDAPTACVSGGGASSSGHTFPLDITLSGFIAQSLITEAHLTIDLADAGGPADGAEKINIWLDGVLVRNNAAANHDVIIDFSSFDLLEDGRLVVELGARTGDFFFEGATLTVWDDPASGPGAAAAVPLPATLLLLTSGLAAVVWRRRVRV